jgi:hypothetical protein
MMIYGKTKWDIIPFLSCAGFLFVFLLPDYSTVMAFTAAVVGLLVTFGCNLVEKREKTKLHKTPEENADTQITAADATKKTKKSKDIQFRIFAAVFGLIAALAITNALETFPTGEECTKDDVIIQQCLDNTEKIQDLPKLLASNPVIIIASFFAIGILFYHCGIMVLSTDIAPLLQNKKIIAFASSLIIFLQGIVLFIAADSTDSLLRFSLWIFLLMALDIAWVLVNIYAKIHMLFQWLHLDTILLLFLLVMLVSPENQGNLIKFGAVDFNYLAVFIVFVMRTAFDYKMGWEYWTKVTPE